jgi:alkylation response protein AidB-like acyl-CoA dehydrogenase
MDFDDTSEEAAFRSEARAWLEATAPRYEWNRASLSDGAALAAAKEWQARKANDGWVALHWPREHGGRGLTLLHSIIYDQEEARYELPRGFFEIGLGICAPPIIAYARDEQKRRYLPKLVRGEEVWCQLFSEPGAGSDLAGLRCRATRDGDSWVVNGQKVWTTGAHYSDWAILVTRHDPSLPKHKGLTFFLVDMKSEGIEARPIKQISGASGFNEVFLSNVRIADENRLGEVGAGWQVAITTLMNERVSSAGRRAAPDVEHLLALAREVELGDGRPAIEDRAVREKLADWYVQARGLELLNARMLTALSQGRQPGPEGSIGKLVSAPKRQDIASFGVDLQELGGIAQDRELAKTKALFQDAYLSSPGARIAAGTDEILRNILAERVLGLPGDIRIDRDRPWSELPSGDRK